MSAGTDRRGLVDGPALRSDLRAAVPDASAALVITVGIFIWLWIRIETGTSSTIEVIPEVADPVRYWVYWLCQAFGWSALLWAWITVVLGLARSTVHPRWLPVSTARIERWHRTTSLSTIGLMFVHAFAFFVDRTINNEEATTWLGRLPSAFIETFVPGGYASGTGLIAILVGLLALYLSIPLGLAYYVRHRSGTRVWQVLHRFIIVVYALSVWHTLLYGTSVWYSGPFRTTIWLLQVPIAVLLLVRLLAPARRGDRLDLTGSRAGGGARVLATTAARLLGRVVVAAGAVVLVVIPFSGRDGGRTRGEDSAPLNVTQTMVWVGLALLLVAIVVAVVRTRAISAERTARRTRVRTPDRDDDASPPP